VHKKPLKPINWLVVAKQICLYNNNQVTTLKPKQHLTKTTSTCKTKPTETDAWFRSLFMASGQEMNRANSTVFRAYTVLQFCTHLRTVTWGTPENSDLRHTWEQWPEAHLRTVTWGSGTRPRPYYKACTSQVYSVSVSVPYWLTCHDHAAKERPLHRRRPLTKHRMHRRKQNTLYSCHHTWTNLCNITAINVEITAHTVSLFCLLNINRQLRRCS